jgi:hypothetical protein
MKEPMEHSAFPSDETLAAFIDGRLDEETRKRVVAHVADCEDCWGTVMASRACQRETDAPHSDAVPRIGRKRRVVIAYALAAGLAGVLLYRPLVFEYGRYHAAASMREAADAMPIRVADARLSLNLAYKPLEPKNRGADDDSVDIDLVAAAAEVRQSRRGDASGEHTVGVAELLIGKRREAVEILRRAIMTETGAQNIADAIQRCTDVPLLSDLSAAEGVVTDFSPDEVSKRIALAASKRAWELDPKSQITVWNRAVATERVNARDAVAAWSDYLAIDRTSAWSGAAKERLEALQRGD